ncbi:hypothetical protein GQ42DRAFT_34220 [Ramicandelaber brevisporus]|nr:hypothetical protein GQ42DRAFT_34220 [Ramicandelaber brevisporus]
MRQAMPSRRRLYARNSPVGPAPTISTSVSKSMARDGGGAGMAMCVCVCVYVCGCGWCVSECCESAVAEAVAEVVAEAVAKVVAEAVAEAVFAARLLLAEQREQREQRGVQRRAGDDGVWLRNTDEGCMCCKHTPRSLYLTRNSHRRNHSLSGLLVRRKRSKADAALKARTGCVASCAPPSRTDVDRPELASRGEWAAPRMAEVPSREQRGPVFHMFINPTAVVAAASSILLAGV